VTEFLDLHGQLNKVVRALADGAMQQHGLHLGQDHLLSQLWARDGQTPGELAAAGGVSTPAVVKMADRMSAAGLLTRARDQRDNRLVRLWLTDKGRSLQKPIEKARRELDDALTADLRPEQKDLLMGALKTVYVTALALHSADRRDA
jgi:DNA-binding MarR family transcriptional regulator